MKISVLFTLLSVMILVSISSCYYDSEEYLYPGTGSQCDTTQVTYAQSIVPIIRNYCLSCHGNSTSSLGGNIKLEDYTDIKLRADDHRLLGSVEHKDGYSPMPKGASKLNNCNIATLRIWIAAGAPNN